MSNQRRATSIPIQHTLETLHAKCQRLSVSNWFGCLNRNGLDEAIAELEFDGLCLVFADVDNLKQANERWGKVSSSARIAQAIKMREVDIVFGQWFSGDEFAAFVPVETAYEFAMHWQSNFKAVDMSISICIAPIPPGVTIESLANQCDERLTNVKQLAKGLIVWLPKEV